MRWMRDIAVVVGLAAVGLGFTGVRQEQRSQDALLASTSEQTRSLERMIKYHAAAKTGELNSRGWPTTVEASWFEHAPPTNPMLDDGLHPWVEVASAEDASLLNPPVRMAISDDMAQFWYNPYQGVVRARVPVMVNDELAGDAYNQVNGTNLKTIFEPEKTADPGASSAPAPVVQKKAAEQRRLSSHPTRRDRSKHEPPVVRVHKPESEQTPAPKPATPAPEPFPELEPLP